MTNQQVAYTLQKSVGDGFSNFMSQLLKDCDLPEDIADLPLNFNTPGPCLMRFLGPWENPHESKLHELSQKRMS